MRSNDRRLSPRARETALYFWRRWVGMSVARRVMVTVVTAAAAGGTTFAACRGDDVTGPPTSEVAHGPQVPRTHSSGNFDDDDAPYYPSKHDKKSREELDDDPQFKESTEVSFPVTEAVYNSCRNELVVLSGELRVRTRTELDALGGFKFKLQEWKDTRGVFGDYTFEEDYWDDDDDSWKKRRHVVRYHNKETLLDRFEVGPFGLPFRSDFISKMHLERDGKYRKDPLVKERGDDLFVFVRESVKIGTDGIPQIRSEFKTECD